MMKKLFLSLGMTLALLGATPEQVERYLMVSGSEDQLIEFEEMVDQLGQMLTAKTGVEVPLMQDSQLVSIRFREYLQQHLSGSEMEEVLANYAHDVMRKLVSAEVVMDELSTRQEYVQFRKDIESDPLPKNRTETVRSIVKRLYDAKALSRFFEKLFLPTYKVMARGSGIALDDTKIEKATKDFVERMQEQNYHTMLFMTRDFTDEELHELEEISGNSASDHEVKAVLGGIEEAMSEAMANMAKQMERLYAQKRRTSTRSTAASSEKKPKTTPGSGSPQKAPARSAE